MANQKHLDILKQGVDVWNRWRKEHPDIVPDLSYSDLKREFLIEVDPDGKDFTSADFSTVNLSGADLSEAFLYGSNFMKADLGRAKLREADLRYTKLIEANFSGADLTDSSLGSADLSRANLSGALLHGTNLGRAILLEANFTQAYLYGTTLTEVVLTEADFNKAYLGNTVFARVDLRSVKNLNTVTHTGPSILDLNTIAISQGQIPGHFLQGTGTPDFLVDYIHSLANTPIEYYTCFISYAHLDEFFARLLYADLQRHGVRCWFASEDLKIGDHYHQRIDESIHRYDKLVLILSEYAIQSSWVEREVVSAREKEDQLRHEVLFPIRLDDAVMQTTKAWAADVRRRWHIGDFTQWKHHDAYQQAFERLLRDLKAEQKSKD